MSRLVRKLKLFVPHEGHFGRSQSNGESKIDDDYELSKNESQLFKIMEMIEKESNIITELNEKLNTEKNDANRARLNRLINMHYQSYMNLNNSYRTHSQILNKKLDLLRRRSRVRTESENRSEQEEEIEAEDRDENKFKPYEESRSFLIDESESETEKRHKEEEDGHGKKEIRHVEKEREKEETKRLDKLTANNNKKISRVERMRKALPNNVDIGFYLNIKR